MTKAELIDRIARSRELPPDITKKCIAKVVETAFDELAAYFTRAKVTRTQTPRFTVPGFGTFTKKRRSARRGVNPRTLEPMVIDSCHTLDFKPGLELRGALNGDASASKAASKRARSAGKRKQTKKSDGKSKRGAARSGPQNGNGVKRRRLTPRDEEAELDELLVDDAVFDEPGSDLGAPRQARSSGAV